jgi:HTH-type transcriptional repressor of NAD biosynthesis genes
LSDAISQINDWDLVIYLEPTVDFVQDGTRNEDMKNYKDIYNKRLKTLFDKRGIKYYSLKGDYLERYDSVINLIDRKLNIKLFY